LYAATAQGEPPFLRSFVSAAFAEILGACPGVGERLFGDLVPIGAGAISVQTSVPTPSEIELDLVIEGEDGFRLLIENRLAPDLEWFEERIAMRPTSHLDAYVAAARHQYAGRARVLVLARSESDLRGRSFAPALFAGIRPWSTIYSRLEEVLPRADPISAHQIRQFLELLKEHDMNPSAPLTPDDADTVLAFDQLARNHLKLLEEAVGRIRQEFILKSTPNNRRLTGWYACSDRFQSDELQFFFYLMFPPLQDLVVRPAVQVTKESSPRALAAAAEHGFRKGRWGSLWIEREFRRRHPFLSLTASRQVEELVRFFQAPLARLAKAGLVKVTPSRHEEPIHADSSAAPRTQAEEHERSATPDEAGHEQAIAASSDREGGRDGASDPEGEG
jgi:hypothetical protein